MKDTLVFSTDPQQKEKCPKCGKLKASCACASPVNLDSKNITAHLRIEKSGRGGKTVTVVGNLPKVEVFLKNLAAELKSKCGVGGSFAVRDKEGVVEIQGDKREALRGLLEKKGMKVKG